MSFGGLNAVGVVMAAIAAFLWSAVYYTLLAKAWQREAGFGPLATPKPGPGLTVTSFVALFVMAWVLAGAVGHLGVGQVTVRNGIVTGLFLWAGFVVSTLAFSHRRQNLSWRLTAIDAGHWLGALILMGLAIGGVGV